ncbi:hypothetical protein LJR267_002946 [Paraburkholderia hospita]|uniref:hypothetical protein n=1 Tax=Paraburkholderia hospita TaxID=169430 RepID=UPI003ECC773B
MTRRSQRMSSRALVFDNPEAVGLSIVIVEKLDRFKLNCDLCNGVQRHHATIGVKNRG